MDGIEKIKVDDLAMVIQPENSLANIDLVATDYDFATGEALANVRNLLADNGHGEDSDGGSNIYLEDLDYLL